MKEHLDFLQIQVPLLLKKLEPGAKAGWGIMTPQHMIEHLVGSWRISNGKAKARQVTPDDKLPGYRSFLYSDKPYQKNMKNPVMPEDLAPLRKKDLTDAIDQLLEDMKDGFRYFEEHPDAVPVHPVFGPLNRGEWMMFQYKHMRHHFEQFGLLGD